VISRQGIFAVLLGWLLCAAAIAQTLATQTAIPLALRAAVPLLCTENNRAAHTRVRGSGVIADSGGTLLTAAHVILQARFDCTLSVMIPDEEWVHAGRLRAFLVGDCHLNQPLDLAVCRIHPAENSRDWGYLRAAPIRLRPALSGEPVWVTAFTGWGLLPLTRSGHVTGRQDYQRQDGCHCDFATDIPAVEGMSGSPVISRDGEVLGILTLAGKEKFRGLSFGVSFEEAKSFLRAEGVTTSGALADHMPGKPGAP
jgi:S1-C subfamily serine protease